MPPIAIVQSLLPPFFLFLAACGGQLLEQDCPDAGACSAPVQPASAVAPPELAPIVGRWIADNASETYTWTLYFRADLRYGQTTNGRERNTAGDLVQKSL